jgi:hypothetical protein
MDRAGWTSILATHLRGDGSSIERRLPIDGKHVFAIAVIVTKVLSKLRNPHNGVGSLDVEAEADDTPDGVYTPGTGPGIANDRFPDSELVLLMISHVAERRVQRPFDLLVVSSGHIRLFGSDCGGHVEMGGLLTQRKAHYV